MNYFCTAALNSLLRERLGRILGRQMKRAGDEHDRRARVTRQSVGLLAGRNPTVIADVADEQTHVRSPVLADRVRTAASPWLPGARPL